MPASITDSFGFSRSGQVHEILRGTPLSVFPDMSIAQMLLQVEAKNAEALVIIDPQSRIPLGLLTLQDMLRRISLDGAELTAPVASIMTSGISVLTLNSPIQQAMTMMVQRRLRHLVIVNSVGELAGLLGLPDLYTLEAGQTDALVERITQSSDIDSLSLAASEIRVLASRLLNVGMGPETLCYWLSTLNDLVTMQVLDLLEPEFDLPLVPWCWMLFGSEGRFEQTLVTDQDNGIIFEADSVEAATRLRALFLPFALAVNQALDRCGFSLCKGGIMASNPRWCLSLHEWKTIFSGWMQTPDPNALLNATIFFDFRALYGSEFLVSALKNYMLEKSAHCERCLFLLAQNALDISPPTRWWKNFVYDDRDFPKTLDLKKFGARLFVDAARVLALANGVAATSTVARLRAAGRVMHLPDADVSAMIDGFFVIQKLRLQQQLHETTPGAENRISPDTLNEIQRQLLREALTQAGKLQQRLQTQRQIV